MSIGEHRHCCVTFKIKGFVWEKTYRFRNQRKWKYFNKKQLTLFKMCVTSLLCGPRAVLWVFMQTVFSLYKGLPLHVTQQCRCSPMLIFRAWATCALSQYFALNGKSRWIGNGRNMDRKRYTHQPVCPLMHGRRAPLLVLEQRYGMRRQIALKHIKEELHKKNQTSFIKCIENRRKLYR